LKGPGDWGEWVRGNREIAQTGESPGLEYTEPLFRRRLSQISRMTIEVIHGLLPLGDRTRIFFLSFRGELTRQLRINRMLVEDEGIPPAAFSLSVFNAPPALAAIAFGLRAGYSALYPQEGDFSAALATAAGAVTGGALPELALVYADELIPEEYGALVSGSQEPLAFGALLSRKAGGVPFPGGEESPSGESPLGSPGNFLKYLYRGRQKQINNLALKLPPGRI
jgi:hypothetical protein